MSKYHEKIKKMITSRERQIEKLKLMNDLAVKADEWQENHPDIVTSWAINCVDHVEIYCKINLLSDLAPLMRDIGKFGYRQHSNYEWARSNSKEWNFEKDGKWNVEVTAQFIKEGDGCKYVKVGEKTEPVYELVCPDGDSEVKSND